MMMSGLLVYKSIYRIFRDKWFLEADDKKIVFVKSQINKQTFEFRKIYVVWVKYPIKPTPIYNRFNF